MSLLTPAQSDPELILQLHQRLTALETKQNVRIGDWVLTQDATTGLPILVTPGQAPVVVGTTALPSDVQEALRGYALSSAVAQAVSGGTTNDLSAATATTVAQNAATAAAQTAAGFAQASGDTANTGVAMLNARVNGVIAGGTAFSDTFSRDGADLGPDYFTTYGAGSGTIGTTTANAGTTLWTPSGFADRSWAATNTANPMTTNRVRVSLVIDQFVWTPTSNQAIIYLIGRSDATQDNAVVALLGNIDSSFVGSAEIGYIVAGVYTRLGFAAPITTGQGDLWDLELGVVGGSDLEFHLLQNNAVVVNETDTLAASQLGAGFDYVGLGGNCYIGAGPFGTTYQGAMPNIQVLAGADF